MERRITDSSAVLQRIRPVSRETVDRLEAFVDLLRRWQRVKNLISANTLDSIWWRHVADSLQLTSLAPLDGAWLDLGSGAGFPGIVMGIAMAEAGGGGVILVESNQRKAAFLQEAIRVTGALAEIRCARVEEALPGIDGNVSVVTARAFAPLAALCGHAQPFVDKGAIALFPKGQDVEAELTEATRYWSMELDRLPSQTDAAATILRIHRLTQAAPAASRITHEHATNPRPDHREPKGRGR